MKRTYAIFYLASIAAVALVVPAIGSSGMPVAQQSASAQKATKLAKKALKLAEENKKRINQLQNAKGEPGPRGAKGDTGPPGPPGALGTASGAAGGALAGAYPNPSLAANAVTGASVLDQSLTGADVVAASLGTVPFAEEAKFAEEAELAEEALGLAGRVVGCPANTTLIRGICFDSESSEEPVSTVEAASDACRTKGGYLPGPLELRSTRNVLDLGTGTGTDVQYTDTFYGNTAGSNYSTVVVSDSGTITEQAFGDDAHYICAYPLIR